MPDPAFVGGDRLLGYGEADPRCRLKCRGNERYRGESPARFGRTPDGEKVVWCPCCNTRLRQARPGESGLGTQAQLAALRPDVSARARVFIDDICRYDVVVFKEFLPAGHPEATPR